MLRLLRRTTRDYKMKRRRLYALCVAIIVVMQFCGGHTVSCAASKDSIYTYNRATPLVTEKTVEEYSVIIGHDEEIRYIYGHTMYGKELSTTWMFTLAFTNCSGARQEERAIRVVIYDRLGEELYAEEGELKATEPGEYALFSLKQQRVSEYDIAFVERMYDYRVFFIDEEAGEYVPVGPEPQTSEDEDAVIRYVTRQNGRLQMDDLMWTDLNLAAGIIYQDYNHTWIEMGCTNNMMEIGDRFCLRAVLYDYENSVMAEVSQEYVNDLEKGDAHQIELQIPADALRARYIDISYELFPAGKETEDVVSGESTVQEDDTENSDVGKSDTTGSQITGDTLPNKEVQNLSEKRSNKKVGTDIIKAVVTKSGNVTVTWEKNKYAVSYEVYRRKSTQKKYHKIASAKGNMGKYTDRKTTRGRTYYYKIKPVFADYSEFAGVFGEKKKVKIPFLRTPVVSLKKGKKSAKRYVEVYFKKYQGKYAQIFVKKDSDASYVKIDLGKKSIANYHRRCRLIYERKKMVLTFKIRTYRYVRGRRRYSGYLIKKIAL